MIVLKILHIDFKETTYTKLDFTYKELINISWLRNIFLQPRITNTTEYKYKCFKLTSEVGTLWLSIEVTVYTKGRTRYRV
jgi:hypothetical protein